MVSQTFALDSNIPADQAMLLRLIDSKFETTNTKIEGIAATLQIMNDRFGHYDKRFDDHDHRLGEIESQMVARKLLVDDYNAQKVVIKENQDSICALEKWQTEEQTTTRNASKWGSAVWTLVGSAATAILGWLIVSYVNATASPSVQVQHSPAVHQVEYGTITPSLQWKVVNKLNYRA